MQPQEDKAQEILETIRSIEEQSEHIRDESAEREREIELGGRADFFALRKKWSTYLFWFLVVTLFFQFFIAISIGLNWLQFPSSTVVAILISESFVQIVGLVYLVVRFLFSPGE